MGFSRFRFALLYFSSSLATWQCIHNFLHLLRSVVEARYSGLLPGEEIFFLGYNGQEKRLNAIWRRPKQGIRCSKRLGSVRGVSSHFLNLVVMEVGDTCRNSPGSEAGASSKAAETTGFLAAMESKC